MADSLTHMRRIAVAAGLAVEAVGLKKAFGNVAVLNDVNLSVAAGSIFALLGRNGAGKPNIGKWQFFSLLPRRPRAASHDTRQWCRPLALGRSSGRPSQDGTAVRGLGRRSYGLVLCGDGRPGRG
jgi:ABC-type protease/lipase transport system fused ATPase/permease subunit